MPRNSRDPNDPNYDPYDEGTGQRDPGEGNPELPQDETGQLPPEQPTVPSAGAQPPVDAARAAVQAAFQKKGLKPRDQADEDYWVNRINQTGGWNNPQNQQYWLERMAAGQGGVGDYLERPEAGGGGGGGTTQSTIGGEELRKKLLELIAGNGQDLSAAVKPQAEAYTREQERAAGNQRAQLAQRLQASGQGAVQGGSSGALESGMIGINENVGNQSAAFHAHLVGQELENRRGQLMQALQIGAGILNQDQMLQIQRELAAIQSAQYQAQLDQRNYEFTHARA